MAGAIPMALDIRDSPRDVRHFFKSQRHRADGGMGRDVTKAPGLIVSIVRA